jgi:CubicO group peptidase (beta-lactamase class C family)/surface polysaccharide O-acyltransferase-like enzyme
VTVPDRPSVLADPRDAASGRDRGLDLLRAVALVRVVTWHATGAAPLTLLAAMPVMFFVSGSLFAASADRRGAWRTVRDRLRRLGPSLWAFALVAWLLMAVAARATGAALDWSHVGAWFLPLTDPVGSGWEGGWLSSPLWYLRTLLWILLLAPALGWLVRKAPSALMAVGVAAVVALEWVDRGLGWQASFAPRLVWQAGDVVLFALFFAFGMWTRSGPTARRVTPRSWAALAGASAVVAIVVWEVLPPPGGVVNDSHVVHLVVGATLLFAVLAAAGPIGRLAEQPWMRPGVDLLGRRSLTVYLWHTAAVAGALWVLGRAGVPVDGVGAPAYVVLIVVGVTALTVATGWIEDLAARRRPTLLPLRRVPRPALPGSGARTTTAPAWRAPVLAGMAAVVLVAAVGLPLVGRSAAIDDAVAFRPRVPSQAPPRPSVIGVADAEPEWWTHPATVDPDALERTLADWAVENGVPGASVAVSVPDGGSWVGVTGVGDDGELRAPSTAVDAMSVTKLFTANLVYRVVDLGLIGLDDPIPAITALPDLPLAGRVTVRQLLTHRSGLANYRDSEQYRTDPTVVQGPADAVALSLAEPTDEPGSTARYSSTNYLILGYLLEQLTGISFDAMLAGSLLEPMGLAHTTHLAPGPGEPRFSTAGIVTDIEDLARAGEELLVRHVGISDGAWQEMSAMDPEAGLGAGTMQFCPCSDDRGVLQAFALGYAGGHTLVAYLPRYDVVVALDVTGDFYGDDGHFEAVEPLLRALAGLLRQAPTGQETALAAPA